MPRTRAGNPDPFHVLMGQVGGNLSWARTADRSARTAPARAASPSDILYWLKKLGPEMDGASEETRIKAARNLQVAYFARLSLSAAQARRRKAAERRGMK